MPLAGEEMAGKSWHGLMMTSVAELTSVAWRHGCHIEASVANIGMMARRIMITCGQRLFYHASRWKAPHQEDEIRGVRAPTISS